MVSLKVWKSNEPNHIAGKMMKIKLLCETRKKKTGELWEIVAIKEGLSENDVFYPADVLERDYQRLWGASSYIYQLGDGVFEHLPEALQETYNGLVGNLIGWFKNPRIEKINEKIAIVADLYIHKAAEQVREFFKDCWEHGRTIGFSITAFASSEKRTIEEKIVDYITELWFLSVDPVSYPAIGDAEAIRLLESVQEGFSLQITTRKERIIMTEELKDKLIVMAKKVLPETTVAEEFERTEAIALITQMFESLDPQSFPEADVRTQLARLRDAIEDDDDETAGSILENLLSLEERGQQLSMLKKLESLLDEKKIDKALEVLTSLSESKPNAKVEEQEKTGVPKTNDERLAAHFGDEKAAKLKELLGDTAFDCLPPRGTKVNETLLWDKLEALQTLIKDEEFEAASNLLKAILEGDFSEPYPYPKPTTVEGPPLPAVDEAPVEEVEEVSESRFGEGLSPQIPPVKEETIVDKKETENAEVEIEELERELDELEKELEEEEAVGELEEDDPGVPPVEEEGEDIQVRMTKIELEKLLENVALPEVTKEKLRVEFTSRGASIKELQTAIDYELQYLSALEYKFEDPRASEIATERKVAQESFRSELSSLQKTLEEEKSNFQKQLATEMKTLAKQRTELQAQIDGMKLKAGQSDTQALLEQKLREANLTSISEQRVRKAFKDKVVTEEEIEKMIAEEVQLTTQIIGEMASTVSGFGEVEEEVDYSEEKAENMIHEFFASRMGVTLEEAE